MVDTLETQDTFQQIPDDADSVDMSDLIGLIAERTNDKRNGPMIARVEAYDEATERADVRPVVHVVFEGQTRESPKIYGVKVGWPAGGAAGTAWAITGPLGAGDIVELIVQDRDHSNYLSSGTVNAPAPTPRRFQLSDVIALPVARVSPLPAGAKAASGPVIYSEGEVYLVTAIGAVKLARADRVEAEMARQRGEDRAHTHPAPGGATGVPSTPLTDPATDITAADKVYGV